VLQPSFEGVSSPLCGSRFSPAAFTSDRTALAPAAPPLLAADGRVVIAVRGADVGIDRAAAPSESEAAAEV